MNLKQSFKLICAEMTHNLWLANSKGVSCTGTGEELPQLEILRADGIPKLDKSVSGWVIRWGVRLMLCSLQ